MPYTVFDGGIGYEGKIKLTLKSNDQIIKTKTYKNSGTAQLFKFLGYCLIDSFEKVKDLVPNKILLLYNESASPIGADEKAVQQKSAWHQVAQTPTIVSDSTTAQVKVVYSFEVPKTSIVGEFNQVALYGVNIPENNQAAIKDFSAYYYLVDEYGAFDIQNPVTWSATTILLIEWELTISNKNTETNNSEEG